MSDISCSVDKLHVYKLSVCRTIEVDRIYEECTKVDGVACAIEWLVGYEVQLLLYASGSVVVYETICYKAREVYRRRVCLVELLCREG